MEEVNYSHQIGKANEMQNWFVEQMFQTKETVLKQVTEQCLGRPFVPSDSHRFEFIKHDLYPGREFFGFDGNLIGEISMYFECEDNIYKAGFKFSPMTKFPEL